MSQTQILLYNFKDEDRLHQIRRYLNRHRISVRMVQQPEYLESLGFLFEIPGFSKNPVFNLGKNFQEEMMVLKDFSSEQLDEFLAFFKENGLLPEFLHRLFHFQVAALASQTSLHTSKFLCRSCHSHHVRPPHSMCAEDQYAASLTASPLEVLHFPE